MHLVFGVWHLTSFSVLERKKVGLLGSVFGFPKVAEAKANKSEILLG
jgi:hypothetical protein